MSDSIFQVAAKIGTPIGLGALIILVLYGLYKLILAKAKGQLLRDIARYLFILALVATVLGMMSYLFIELKKLNAPPPVIPPERRIVNLNVKDMPLEVIFKSITSQIGIAFATPRSGEDVNAKLQETLSLQMSAEVKDAMDEICALKSCEWEIQPGGKEPVLFVHFN